MKTLKDTIDLMLSDSWDDRLRAEIYQCQIRKNKLKDVLDKMPKDDPSYEMLESQYIHMIDYLVDLQSRAAAFGVVLDSEYEREEPDPMLECCCCCPLKNCDTTGMYNIALLIAMDLLSRNGGSDK